jgi:nucleoid-associated protein YgaU
LKSALADRSCACPGSYSPRSPVRAALEEASMSTENPYSQYHVVQKDETLSKIAEEYYGDKMLYPKIFEANKDILQDPDKIKPGQRLRIP